MKFIWLNKEILYDGTQLRSGWIREQTDIEGDAIASFIGPADVSIENMVDLEDVANDAPIFSKSMLHFIIEHPNCSLELGIARQRLIVAITTERLIQMSPDRRIERRGDDIYDGDKKISVSIATTSPTSCLIHFAMNIVSDGTPVPTKGLDDYGIDPISFAKELSLRYVEETASMEHASTKVRAVS